MLTTRAARGRCPATQDIRELQRNPSPFFTAAPVEVRPAVRRHPANGGFVMQPSFALRPQGDMFEWHFTIRGPPDTEFEGGIYHGRIMLPTDYPFKPPNIMFLTVRLHRAGLGSPAARPAQRCALSLHVSCRARLTSARAARVSGQPNGRFQVRTKICLSISSYHPEEWQPAWGSECARQQGDRVRCARVPLAPRPRCRPATAWNAR